MASPAEIFIDAVTTACLCLHDWNNLDTKSRWHCAFLRCMPPRKMSAHTKSLITSRTAREDQQAESTGVWQHCTSLHEGALPHKLSSSTSTTAHCSKQPEGRVDGNAALHCRQALQKGSQRSCAEGHVAPSSQSAAAAYAHSEWFRHCRLLICPAFACCLHQPCCLLAAAAAAAAAVTPEGFQASRHRQRVLAWVGC